MIKQTKKLVKENGILCETTERIASHVTNQKIIDSD